MGETIVIDEKAYEAARHYVDNLMRYFEMDNQKYGKELTEEELIDKLVEVAMEKRKIQLENNDFIFKYIVPFEKGEQELTEELAAFYLYFCGLLRNVQEGNYFDRGINLRVMRLRKKYYDQSGKWGQYLHATYMIGYFSTVLCDHCGGKTEIEGHEIIENIKDEYVKVPFNINTYGLYEVLMMGVYVPSEPGGVIKRYKKILEYTEKGFPELLEDDHPRHHSVDYFNMDTASQFITAYKENPGQFDGDEVAIAREIERKITAIVENKSLQYQNEAARLILHELRFCLGAYTAEELLDKLLGIFNEDINGTTIDRVTRLFKTAALYLEDLWLYAPYDDLQKLKLSETVYQQVLRKYDEVKSTGDIFYMVVNRSDFIAAWAKFMGFDKAKNQVLEQIVYADKSLYIHTAMVRNICMIIVEEILKDNPGFFDGVADYDASFIAKHPAVLLELMSQSALFHDVGKFFCIDYVSNSSRNLTDDEFMAIKYHPENFDIYFPTGEGEEFQCVRDCARLHHLWHNGKGGYPIKLSHTKNLPMVDVLSIADSIDAATDIIGRPYTSGKTLDSLIEEFDTFRDTRYSAYVIDIIKKPEVISKIQYAITVERKHINYEIMRE